MSEVLSLANSVKAVKGTRSTDASQWPDHILSSSTTGLLTKGALLPLCRISDASTHTACN